MIKRKKWFLIIGAIVILGIGAVAGFFITKKKPVQTVTIVRETSSDYKFIDPLLFLEVPESSSLPEYSSLKNILNDAISKAVSSNKASSISVYFRDLNSNHWIGINTDEKFSPASMLKVGTLIAVLHQAESDPEILSRNVIIQSLSPDSSTPDFYPPKDPVEVGNTYTVQDLLSHMIIDSDNTATLALQSLIGDDNLKKTYDDLQIPMPTTLDDSVTAQEYSHFFRVLYSATYLDPNISDQALELLSRTTFDQGLVSGVPVGTLVAHKFGERTFLISSSTISIITPDQPHELHDCGIVYYPDHPYFLCVMTKGNDFQSLAAAIQNISSLVWKNVPLNN